MQTVELSESTAALIAALKGMHAASSEVSKALAVFYGENENADKQFDKFNELLTPALDFLEAEIGSSIGLAVGIYNDMI